METEQIQLIRELSGCTVEVSLPMREAGWIQTLSERDGASSLPSMVWWDFKRQTTGWDRLTYRAKITTVGEGVGCFIHWAVELQRL